MRLLDAINLVLRTNGQGPINQDSSDDQKAQMAKLALERTRREILAQRWQFNTHKITLTPDASDRVPLPRSYLSYRMPKDTYGQKLDPDDGLLYVWDIKENEWYAEKIEDVWISFDIEDFTAIPDAFAQWIAYQAASDFYHELNSQPSRYLAAEAVRRRSIAINSTARSSIHTGTGWNHVRSFTARMA